MNATWSKWRVRIRDAAALVVLLAAMAYGAYRELDLMATTALILFVCVAFKTVSKRFVLRLLGFVDRLTSAKYKDVELTAADRRILLQVDPSTRARLTLAQWEILSQMELEEVGILLGLLRDDYPALNTHLMPSYRWLRERGLIAHETGPLKDADRIWLTVLGREIAGLLDQSSL